MTNHKIKIELKQYFILLSEYNRLKNRIDKAIEYIEQHKETRKHYEPYGTPTGIHNYTTTHIFGYYELLETLKGEDNE